MLQAACLDGQLLNLLSHLQDFRAATVVNVCRGQVAKALVVAAVVIVADKGADLPF